MLLLFVPTGYILSLVLLTLPRQHLVKLYLYVLTALLLFAGHQVSRYTHPCYVTLLNALIDTECLLWHLVPLFISNSVRHTKFI